MTGTPSGQHGAAKRVLALLRWIEQFRYIKFGIVGASGTVVNLAMLHLGHEYIFYAIESAYKKPYFSLALAIALATVNNFTWNRLWTWSDRVKAQADSGRTAGSSTPHLLKEFGQYATASGFGSALQYGLTLLLSGSMDYRLANIVAIVIASVSNFLANDKWTFKRR
jgi:dolichol-phosphate mannosyltransferase